MKRKVVFFVVAIMCVIVFGGGIRTQAAEVIQVDRFMEKDNKAAATTNALGWAKILEAVNSSEDSTTIQFGTGKYYVDNTLKVPSNAVIKGATTNAKDSELVFTAPKQGLTTEAANAANPKYIKNVLIRDISIRYEIDQVIMSGHAYAFSLINFAGDYKDDSTSLAEPYERLDNIQIDNIIADGNEQANSIIYLGGIKNGSVKNSEIRNSNLQSGIAMEYCQTMVIEKNKIENIGRAGIVMYRGNGGSGTKQISIIGNEIKDWMQRYGTQHFYAPANMEYSADDRKSMVDGGIDSYGAANNNIIIDSNRLIGGEGSNKYNPSNIKINNIERRKKDSLATDLSLQHEVQTDKDGKIVADSVDATLQKNMTGYTAIRLSGAENVRVTNNFVQLDSYDNFAFMALYERDRQGVKTTPKNIIIKNNDFNASGRIRYPIRILTGAVNKSRGISIENNRFDIDGLVDNYYKVMVEVRNPVELLSVTDNQASWDKQINGWVTVADTGASNYINNLLIWGNSGTKKTDVTRVLNNTMPSTLRIAPPELPNSVTPFIENLYSGYADYKVGETNIKGMLVNNQGRYQIVMVVINGIGIKNATVNPDGSFLINVKANNITKDTQVAVRYRVNGNETYDSEMQVKVTE
ncbi:right-handed parallel beta-helix repeat-containing protein [Listeria sp. FSL L7-1582]|uniref:right-handed parallel beta-helix repeat-containing protein n=1 Tax=Listeria portnoyi TaxID=2713504 RepID=UPI00164D158D|nr:right-handed parallel beta-helix repeat-containing protein [Listeria portnoyi]MBC6310274.1 right-handed parallel beta-helix repeat-containing protein [Listeria portnoyi]